MGYCQCQSVGLDFAKVIALSTYIYANICPRLPSRSRDRNQHTVTLPSNMKLQTSTGRLNTSICAISPIASSLNQPVHRSVPQNLERHAMGNALSNVEKIERLEKLGRAHPKIHKLLDLAIEDFELEVDRKNTRKERRESRYYQDARSVREQQQEDFQNGRYAGHHARRKHSRPYTPRSSPSGNIADGATGPPSSDFDPGAAQGPLPDPRDPRTGPRGGPGMAHADFYGSPLRGQRPGQRRPPMHQQPLHGGYDPNEEEGPYARQPFGRQGFRQPGPEPFDEPPGAFGEDPRARRSPRNQAGRSGFAPQNPEGFDAGPGPLEGGFRAGRNGRNQQPPMGRFPDPFRDPHNDAMMSEGLGSPRNGSRNSRRSREGGGRSRSSRDSRGRGRRNSRDSRGRGERNSRDSRDGGG